MSKQTKQEAALVKEQQGEARNIPKGSMCDVLAKHRVRTGRIIPPQTPEKK